MLDRQIYNTLPPEQFSAHFGVCCVLTRSIVKSTDANKRELRQQMYKMLFFTEDCASQALSDSVRWPSLYKNCSSDSTL